MKITRICLLEVNKNEEIDHLNDLMRTWCSAIRYSFNRLVEGEKSGDVIKIVQQKFGLNKRYSEDAVLHAQAVILSQIELLPTRIEGVQGKIQKTIQKIEDYQTGKKWPKKVPVEICLAGLKARLDKLLEKESVLLTHREQGTIPTVIFGGKKNFYDRLDNKISLKEWKELRANTLYSRGDKSKKGNLNTRMVLDETENQFYIEVANPLLKNEGKKNSPRLRFRVHIPDKYFVEIINIVMPNVVGKTPTGKPMEEYQVYSIEIKRRGKKYYVHMTYDLETFGSELKWSEKITSDIVAGIDVNIDKITVTILTKQGCFLESRTFYCHEMEYVKSNRRTNVAGETAKEIIDYLLQWNVGAFVLEDLKFKQDHDTVKRFNRLVHSFAKNKLQNALISKGTKFGFKIKKVNPAYTSVIGRFKYTKMYGLSVHEAASFVIGRRGLDFEEKIPKELINHLRSLVKPMLIHILGSMEESREKSINGKQRRKFIAMMLKNIDDFKENHSWKLWNVIHKTLLIKNQVLQLKEV
ncbi:IS200/IS605 family accessory protein TnpB-related protein [Neobacillus soli]|uniref:IS200/IS605 family accessory protein TnpB-related protein n=1 Tax=Neobacillus soli TaxID=220688 RepID=UPI0008270F04|nr:IS200/IS605 family accessory protein TnpB-related protein [Neobacillus soli]